MLDCANLKILSDTHAFLVTNDLVCFTSSRQGSVINSYIECIRVQKKKSYIMYHVMYLSLQKYVKKYWEQLKEFSK